MNSELVRATNHLNNTGRCKGWIEQPEEIQLGIYCWTNTVNGKKYVGQSMRLQGRKNDFIKFHNEYAGDLINRARQKYPSISFWGYSVLEYCDDSQLNEREQHYVNKFSTNQRDKGYNLTIGGEGAVGRTITPEYIEKCRNSDYIKGREKAVIQINPEGQIVKVFRNANEAERETGVRHGNIRNCCVGVYSQCNNFRWIYANDYDPNIDYSFNHREKNSPILQLDKDGNFIREWGTIKEAAESLGCTRTGICNAAIGVLPSCKGFLWKYKDDQSEKSFNDGRHKRRIPVYQIDPISGVIIKRWSSASEVEFHFVGKRTGNVKRALSGINSTAYGFIWRYADNSLLEK